MSLSASMWTSVTGLLVHGEKMNVVGNNIANVNTVGFKGSRMDFEDFVHQSVYSAAGPTQVGRGAAIGAIYGNFQQGSFENSTDPTDLAINGKGFFKVKPKDSNTEYLTRAGNFRFDADGYLADPHGYVLQGWQIQRPRLSLGSSGGAAGAGETTGVTSLKGSGVPVDVKLDGFTCEPKHTNNMTAGLSLDSRDGGDRTMDNIQVPNPAYNDVLTDPLNTTDKYLQVPTAGYSANYLDPTHADFAPSDPRGYPYPVTVNTPPTFATPPNANAGYNAAYLDPTNALFDPSNPDAYAYDLDPAAPAPSITAVQNPNYDPSITATIPQGVNPFFALLGEWDATNLATPALGSESYAYQHTMTVYDEGGSAHKLTIYFDQVSAPGLANANASERYWEYIVTMEPGDDVRTFGADGADPIDRKMRGVLMAGTMTFDKSGQLQNTSAFVPSDGADAEQLNTWVPAPVSSNGYPLMAPNFSGRDNASQVWDDPATMRDLNHEAEPYMIELNLGVRNKNNTWAPGGPANAAAVGNDRSQLLGIATSDVEVQNEASVSFPSPSASMYEKQDGYTFGYLSSVYVDRDGILYGKYSNGQSLALYQISLYDVPSKDNLYREGGNLYSVTRDSGDMTTGPANSAGFGSVHGNSLEQSNVDLATEFVQMITTQRGFQANSKSITTVDTMLETVIGMKR